jgi:hypothetical protein
LKLLNDGALKIDQSGPFPLSGLGVGRTKVGQALAKLVGFRTQRRYLILELEMLHLWHQLAGQKVLRHHEAPFRKLQLLLYQPVDKVCTGRMRRGQIL